MGEIFPRAKNVVWEGATPRILANNEMYYANIPSAGFTGFLQTEEIVMVIKHAETPHRLLTNTIPHNTAPFERLFGGRC
ncbi:hypothetical protein LTR17_000042 [Elasticomyces elasticus]|nr:hypothetical protein LTR17_000042 [Elasticomyces elasticus]